MVNNHKAIRQYGYVQIGANSAKHFPWIHESWLKNQLLNTNNLMTAAKICIYVVEKNIIFKVVYITGKRDNPYLDK